MQKIIYFLLTIAAINMADINAAANQQGGPSAAIINHGSVSPVASSSIESQILQRIGDIEKQQKVMLDELKTINDKFDALLTAP